MKKFILAPIFLIGMMTAGCGDQPSKEEPPQKIGIDLSKVADGVYTADSSRDEKLGIGQVTLTVENHKIVDANFVGYDLFGNVKDEEYGALTGKDSADYKKAQIAVKANDEYAKQLIETQSLDGIDAISGATISYNQFVEAVNKAIGKPTSYERSERVMGTRVTLRAEGTAAQAAVDESFDKVNELVEKIKVDVERINAAAGSDEFIKISPEVFEMIRLSRQYSDRTDGAFDVTVGAALDLWKAARQNNALPTDEEIEAARRLVGRQHMNLRETDNAVMLDEAGVKINVGGIAKGYAADLVREIFVRHGIEDGLIDFGTSTIYAVGAKKIGIKNPRGGGIDEIAELNDGALSTSGVGSTITSSIRKRVARLITGSLRQASLSKATSLTARPSPTF